MVIFQIVVCKFGWELLQGQGNPNPRQATDFISAMEPSASADNFLLILNHCRYYDVSEICCSLCNNKDHCLFLYVVAKVLVRPEKWLVKLFFGYMLKMLFFIFL